MPVSLVTKTRDISPDSGEVFSKVPAEFARWANQVREVQSVKAGRRGVGPGGAVRWWSRLPESLRLYLLSTVAPDDWERYAGADWAALPEGLRSVIALECRGIGRAVAGCPWR